MRAEGGRFDRGPVWNPKRTNTSALIKHLGYMAALMEDSYAQKLVFQLGRLTTLKREWRHDRVQKVRVAESDANEKAVGLRGHGVSWKLFQPDVAVRDFDNAGPLNFNRDRSLRPAEFRIRIHKNGHDMPVDDVGERVSVGDDLHLVPLTRFDKGFQFIGAAESRKEGWLLARLGGHNLTTPRDDAARRILLVQLARIFVVEVEIGLVARNIPLGVLALEILLPLPPLAVFRTQACRDRFEMRFNMEAAILNSAIRTGSFEFHLHLQFEVSGFPPAPDDVGCAGRVFRA